MKMKTILSAILLAVSLGLPVFVSAQGGTAPSTCEAGKFCNPIIVSEFPDLVSLVTKTAVNILMPFVVLGFMYSGFLFVRAQGNEKGLEEAKSAIYWSVIGAFILFGAWGFAQVIGSTLSTITN